MKAVLVVEVVVDGRLKEPFDRIVRAVGSGLERHGQDIHVRGLHAAINQPAEDILAIIEENA